MVIPRKDFHGFSQLLVLQKSKFQTFSELLVNFTKSWNSLKYGKCCLHAAGISLAITRDTH